MINFSEHLLSKYTIRQSSAKDAFGVEDNKTGNVLLLKCSFHFNQKFKLGQSCWITLFQASEELELIR